MKKLTLIFTAIIILILSACAPSQNKEGESFFAMDTYMQAEVYGDRQTVNDIKAEIESLDKKLSSVNPESEIYKLNKSGSLKLDGESAELIKRSVELCGFTDGNLDITVYPVVEKWGFIDKNYKIPTQSELDSLLKNVDYKKITVNCKFFVLYPKCFIILWTTSCVCGLFPNTRYSRKDKFYLYL